ncbi:secretin N-terminal domain-containing protein [Cellvibrio fontiphilus]|uniref:Secretin N-terminal domain-containing protein n=1 Tax=Cellvibrio fontiphilus TaxID=1815559 RepID=A0ABV7FE09_9GAMM
MNPSMLLTQFARSSLLVLSVVALSSCSLMPDSQFAPPAKLKSSTHDEKANSKDNSSGKEAPVAARFSPAPVTSGPRAAAQLTEEVVLFPQDEQPSISLSIDSLPLPAFINEVFANELKLDFQIAPEVSNKTDLVTLRVTEARNRQAIFELARQVLSSYGVIIIQQGDLLRFVLGDGKKGPFEPPLIVTGNALPSVPSTHRPIFLVRNLNVVNTRDAANVLESIFRGQQLGIDVDAKRNAVTLNGAPDLVQSAAEVLTMLDQPSMKGRYSLRIDPLFTDVDTLFRSMQSTLGAQGYDVGGVGSNITLVPIKELNALFAFVSTAETLSLVKQWAEQLDKVTVRADSKDGFYWYQVRNTGAGDLAATLNAALTGSSAATQPQAQRNAPATANTRNPPAGANQQNASSRTATTVTGQFVVDAARNMLLFRGSADRWQEILPLIKELDQAPAQVLVEVVVAEVTLSDQFRFGMEWAMSEVVNGASGELRNVYGDDGLVGSGVGGTGLSWTSLSSSGATRLALNAFASNNKVSILQTPKLLVRSGQSATVSVGQKIPLLVSQTVANEQIDGDTGSRQNVEYRDTGISLSVTPTVFSDGRIDMDIQQEVSGSSVTEGTVNLTPIVSSRTISTSLSLRDGGSVLLGGLITREQTKGNSRVPVLGALPIVGHLFRTDSSSAGTTELMILVVPYLVRDADQAEALTKSFRQQLSIPSIDEDLSAP